MLMKVSSTKFHLGLTHQLTTWLQRSNFLLWCAAFIFMMCISVSTTVRAQYDAQLAERLQGDDYGMKRYVMALLKKGPHRPQDKQHASTLQKQHMDNISRLAKEGKLVLAGPFLDEGDLRGIYIFNVSTIEEAQALTATDPAIQAGSLVMELHPWYGSAALMDINRIHQSITKSK
ncbi:YciI family protein [Shewanella waksmanii]|uniref:YciI family protein n=1 Tax=Shewanella waksmanii TaxID=213783 RepID=UPI0004ACD0FC|nr:YciI family protein [Shewanella waksmanii]